MVSRWSSPAPCARARRPNGWRAGWIIIGHSSLLGDPYFLDVSSRTRGGLPRVHGDERHRHLESAAVRLQFRDVSAHLGRRYGRGQGLPRDDIDMDDEQVFREALGPKIREYDPAALKAGHWT